MTQQHEMGEDESQTEVVWAAIKGGNENNGDSTASARLCRVLQVRIQSLVHTKIELETRKVTIIVKGTGEWAPVLGLPREGPALCAESALLSSVP